MIPIGYEHFEVEQLKTSLGARENALPLFEEFTLKPKVKAITLKIWHVALTCVLMSKVSESQYDSHRTIFCKIICLRRK